MRVFVITSHYIGVLYIRELLEAGDEIVGVTVWPGAVGFYETGWYVPPDYDPRAEAFRHNLPVYEPDPKDINKEPFLSVVRNLEPDWIVSGYYARLFREQLRSIPKYGCVNMHPSRLPEYRGRSPYFSHMIGNDTHNWISLHHPEPGADTGAVIAQASVPILPEDTGFTTGHKVTEAGAVLFREMWPLLKAGKAPTPQKQNDAEATVFNFDWDQTEIDWSRTAVQNWSWVRSCTRPFTGCWTIVGGHKLHIWKVRVVDPAQETRSAGSVPGQVLRVTNDEMRVQCGQGQIDILEAMFDDEPRLPLNGILLMNRQGLAGPSKIVLG
jgi:methionyl-tRNA formyltransferase